MTTFAQKTLQPGSPGLAALDPGAPRPSLSKGLPYSKGEITFFKLLCKKFNILVKLYHYIIRLFCFLINTSFSYAEKKDALGYR